MELGLSEKRCQKLVRRGVGLWEEARFLCWWGVEAGGILREPFALFPGQISFKE